MARAAGNDVGAPFAINAEPPGWGEPTEPTAGLPGCGDALDMERELPPGVNRAMRLMDPALPVLFRCRDEPRRALVALACSTRARDAGSTLNLAMASRTKSSSSSWRTSSLCVLKLTFCAVLLFAATKMLSRACPRRVGVQDGCQPQHGCGVCASTEQGRGSSTDRRVASG